MNNSQTHKYVKNKYQIAGLDDRERGFNRLAEVTCSEEGYCAALQYETTRIVTDWYENEVAALLNLISQLHARGYIQLRTRLNFQGETYLGSQHEWVEHPHPESKSKSIFDLVDWFRRLITVRPTR